MRYSIILWDADGVAYPGRGTTHLAAGSKMNPHHFIERFTYECGREGPLSDVETFSFLIKLSLWGHDNNTELDSVKKLGAALTDLRHVHGIFKSKHTKYTKNAILEGISMKDIVETMKGVELTHGFEKAVEGFHRDGRKQILFSNASAPIADFLMSEYEMDYADGLPVYIKIGEGEALYRSYMYGNPKIVLAGRAVGEFDKLHVFESYVEREGIDLENVAAIDDDHVGILSFVKEGGGLPFGFRVKEKYRKGMEDKGIEIIENEDVAVFLEKVREAEKRLK